MNEQFGPIGDMITLVASSQHAEATPVLHDLLGARILDALQGHKQVIAQSLFAPSADALAEETKKKSTKDNPSTAFAALANMSKNIKHDINKVKKLKEELVQEEHESVEDFKKRGGTVKQIPAHKSYSAPKSQKIKVPFRMGKSAMREESEQLEEGVTRKHFQQVADVIKTHPDAAKRRELAAHHAGIFKTQNPRFDHKRFYAAANAGEPGV